MVVFKLFNTIIWYNIVILIGTLIGLYYYYLCMNHPIHNYLVLFLLIVSNILLFLTFVNYIPFIVGFSMIVFILSSILLIDLILLYN